MIYARIFLSFCLMVIFSTSAAVLYIHNRNRLEQIPLKAYGPAPSNINKNVKSAPLLDY